MSLCKKEMITKVIFIQKNKTPVSRKKTSENLKSKTKNEFL